MSCSCYRRTDNTDASELLDTAVSTGIANYSGLLRVGDGSAAAPAYSFASDTDTGPYRVGANTWGVAAGGTEILEVSPTQILGKRKVTLISHTDDPAQLALTFEGNTTCGFYQPAINNIGFVTNGVKRFAITLTAVDSVLPLTAPSVTADQFHYDTNDFTYLGPDGIGVVHNSVETADFSDTAILLNVPVYTVDDFHMDGTMSSVTQPLYHILGTASTQSIPDSTLTVVTWGGTATQWGSEITFASNTITLTTDGIYLLNATGVWNSTAGAGKRELLFSLNGGTAQNDFVGGNSTMASANSIYQTAICVYKATAGDTIKVYAFQNSGAALNFRPTTHESFSALRLF